MCLASSEGFQSWDKENVFGSWHLVLRRTGLGWVRRSFTLSETAPDLRSNWGFAKCLLLRFGEDLHDAIDFRGLAANFGDFAFGLYIVQ